jgi:tetratricopeptide (TPR) repeat protein
VSPGDFQPLAHDLRSAGRTPEAAIVCILGARALACLAESPEGPDPPTSELATRICDWVIELSRERGFLECEARFSAAFGAGAAKRNDRQTARLFLERAANLYAEIDATNGSIYRPGAAMTLANLGMVLQDERQLPAAVKALRQSAEFFRELAVTEPQTYRADLATTLNALGIALSEAEDLSDACAVFEEAATIY